MPPRRAPADRVSSTRVLAASLAAIVFAAMVFVVWPGLDLGAAALFWHAPGPFAGQTPLGEALRRLFNWGPFVLFAALVLLHAARRAGLGRLWAPDGAGVVFLALSLALGPGLFVNTLLKEHSHRPRPYQVTQFGGDETFRPFYRFDGACHRNCSFVSGEGSTAFWTLAPALLAPPPVKLLAIGAALLFGLATSLLRMAFGGHFLSDSVFAALFTWLVILGCWRTLRAVLRRPPGSLTEAA